MAGQLSLLVLVFALASGLGSSMVITTFLQKHQAVFFRYLLTNILLFNLLILSGMVLQYLQFPFLADRVSAYWVVLPMLLTLMAALKLAWLLVFLQMNRQLRKQAYIGPIPKSLLGAGAAIWVLYALLLFSGWILRREALVNSTITVLELLILSGALYATLELIAAVYKRPKTQRRLSMLMFGYLHLGLLAVVFTFLMLHWFGPGLPDSNQLLVNGVFLALFNLIPLVWLKWFLPESVPAENEKFAEWGITPREKEIIHLIQAGKTNQEIAEQLFISIATVKDHNHNIFRKCGVRNRLELARLFS